MFVTVGVDDAAEEGQLILDGLNSLSLRLAGTVTGGVTFLTARPACAFFSRNGRVRADSLLVLLAAVGAFARCTRPIAVTPLLALLRPITALRSRRLSTSISSSSSALAIHHR
jgi:hypothetical protein